MAMAPDPRGGHPLRVAYLMSRFPKLSETFVLYEMLELERIGVHVEVFPLVREREVTMQPGAEDFVARAHDLRLTSRPVLAAQWHWLRRRPRRYLATWGRAILERPLAGSSPGRSRWSRLARRSPVGSRNSTSIRTRALGDAPGAGRVGRAADRPDLQLRRTPDIYVERPMLDQKLRGAAFTR
jgi:hypothetical protein